MLTVVYLSIMTVTSRPTKLYDVNDSACNKLIFVSRLCNTLHLRTYNSQPEA